MINLEVIFEERTQYVTVFLSDMTDTILAGDLFLREQFCKKTKFKAGTNIKLLQHT